MNSVKIKIPKSKVLDEKTKESSIIKDILPEIEYYQFEEFSPQDIEAGESNPASYFENYSDEELLKKKPAQRTPKKKLNVRPLLLITP
ncbi:MAG: hypothetical protein ACK42Z_01200 [Candidatus Kapaibacteriota bacterium]